MRNKRFFVLLCVIICFVIVVSSSPINTNGACNSSDEAKSPWHRTRVMSRDAPNTPGSDNKDNKKKMDLTFGRDMKEWLYTRNAVLNSSCTFTKAFGRLCSVFKCDKGKTLYCEMERRTGPCPKCLKTYENSFNCRSIKINGIKDNVEVCKLGGMVRSLGAVSKFKNEMNACIYRDVMSLSGNLVDELTKPADGKSSLVRGRRYFRRKREDTTEAQDNGNVEDDKNTNGAVEGNEDNDNSDKTTTQRNVKDNDDTNNSKGASTTSNTEKEDPTEATVETTTVDGTTEISETSADDVTTASEGVADETVTTNKEDKLTTKSETEVTTQSEEEGTKTSEENQEVETTTEDKMTTKSDEEMTTKSDEEMTTKSDTEVTTKSDEEMTTKSDTEVTTKSEENEEMGTTSEDKMTTKSDEEMTTKSETELTTKSEDEVTKTSEENEEVGTTSMDKLKMKSAKEETKTPKNDGGVVTPSKEKLMKSSKEQTTAATGMGNKVTTTPKDTNEGDNSIDDRSIEQKKKPYDVLKKLFREHSDFLTFQIKKHLKKRVKEGKVTELLKLTLSSMMGNKKMQRKAALNYLKNEIQEQFLSSRMRTVVVEMLLNLGRDLKVGVNGKLFR